MNPSLISKLTKPHLLFRIWKKIRSLFILDQWIILIAPSAGYKSLSWSDFKPIVPPLDRFWADPFVWMHKNRHYIFIEEVLYSTHRGRIVCLTLDKEMNIQSNQIVLERPYHISYPFLFEYEGQLYMIPETKENNGIELYCCTKFPDQWEFVKTLIDNIHARDATLLEASGKWWLFTNIQETGSLSWDNVHLYYADHPLSDQWTPHPCNPIIKDIRSARPAGRIFSDNNKLIRPSQDCSVRYGYAISFNQIITLTETDYAETCEQTFKPVRKNSIHAT
ncbi:MAG: hypothetical protein MUO77_15725, partial [Anaerolineales bacterium]|nr:hypothetical protein [Anaerolineales bacterium]